MRERWLQSRPKGKSKNREGRGRNVEKGTSREAVDAIISAITDSLGREERVTLVGFGTFQTMKRKARTGVNPQTREVINIPAKKVPKFRPGKGLREKVESRK
ncbi:MAG: HU family DNA-binding protein [Candidatus Aerophobus sp.]|nr:MAG: HU family DNA-binding protein [Candidatus Aerophobus sp.]